MIDWQPIYTAPRDGTEVLIAFREERVYRDGSVMIITTSPGYYDNGVGDEGEQYQEPGWWYFDSHETAEVNPLAWAPYPTLNEEALKKLGISQVPA